jgi:hypothetical protein
VSGDSGASSAARSTARRACSASPLRIPPRRSASSRRADGQAPAALAELARDGRIVYAPFPPQLVGKYQHFTQADLTALRGAGYAGEFASVEEGVARYVESLISSQQGSP